MLLLLSFVLGLLSLTQGVEFYMDMYTDLEYGGRKLTTYQEIEDLSKTEFDNRIQSYCGLGM